MDGCVSNLPKDGDLCCKNVSEFQDHLTDLLENCATWLQKSERYELLGEIYRFILPIYEQKRDFQV